MKHRLFYAAFLLGLVLVPEARAATPAGRASLQALFQDAGPSYTSDVARCEWLQERSGELDVQLGFRRELPSAFRLEVDGRHWGTLQGATQLVVRQESGHPAVLWLAASAQAAARLRKRVPSFGQHVAVFLEQGAVRVPVFCGRVGNATFSSKSGLGVALYTAVPSKQGRKTRRWEQMTAGDIVAEIAQELGLEPEVNASSEVIAVLQQRAQAPWDFLRDLAQRTHHSLRLENHRVHFSQGGFVPPPVVRNSRVFRDMTYGDVVTSLAGEHGFNAEIALAGQDVESLIRQSRSEDWVFLRSAGLSRGFDFRLEPGQRVRVTGGNVPSKLTSRLTVYELSLQGRNSKYEQTAIRMGSQTAQRIQVELRAAVVGKGSSPAVLAGVGASLPHSSGARTAIERVVRSAQQNAPGDPVTAFLAAEAERYKTTLEVAFALHPGGPERLNQLAPPPATQLQRATPSVPARR